MANGVRLADDRSNTLWVCQNATDGRGGAPVTGQTALRAFDLKSGAAKGTYPFPAKSGICNDIAVPPNGTAYRFTVVAHSADGDSAPSAPSAAVTPEPMGTSYLPTTGRSRTGVIALGLGLLAAGIAARTRYRRRPY